MAIIRDKLLTIKTTAAEREGWQAQAKLAGLTLADLIRQRLGNSQEVSREPIRRRSARRADPLLLQNIGRVGSNLNQIARWANTYKSGAQAVQVLTALVALEQILLSYLPPRGSGTKPLAEDDAG